MNIKINNNFQTMIVTDDGITLDSISTYVFWPYGSIKEIANSHGKMKIIGYERGNDGKEVFIVFLYNKRKNGADIIEIIEFAKKQMITAERSNRTYIDKVKRAKEEEKREYRMRCNVCGKIFCFTIEDLKSNSRNAGIAALSSISAIASSIGGTAYGAFESNKQADRYSSKIIDYNKCPNCNSTNLTILSDEDYEKIKNQENTSATTIVQQSSVADEIKKFKELLDMGVITEEEFNAKKKQLLGL